MPRSTPTTQTPSAFHQFNLRPELLEAVHAAGYDAPRPVQARALPPALAGRDVLGLAQTGTGKTAAFVLPILQRLLAEPGSGPRALVVAPTRELAAQVHAELERLGRRTPLTSTVVFGGVPIARQVRALRRRPDVIVACPGRLLDLLDRRALCLSRIEVLVLDEADHMFDMGFLPHVRRILRALPSRRQNLLFSATMPREIRGLADAVLQQPTVVELAHSRPAETIAHSLCVLAEGDKVAALERLLASDDFRSAIVFLRTKRRAKTLARRLGERGHAAVALQGNMSQPQRERALLGFRKEHFDVLVATDIAARGLDIAGVSHVVNFDVPNTPDAYTHRIGRTGRSEQRGRAFTFVTPGDADAVRAIEKRLGTPIERRRSVDLGRVVPTMPGDAEGSRSAETEAPKRRKARRPRRKPARPAATSGVPRTERRENQAPGRSEVRPAAAERGSAAQHGSHAPRGRRFRRRASSGR